MRCRRMSCFVEKRSNERGACLSSYSARELRNVARSLWLNYCYLPRDPWKSTVFRFCRMLLPMIHRTTDLPVLFFCCLADSPRTMCCAWAISLGLVLVQQTCLPDQPRRRGFKPARPRGSCLALLLGASNRCAGPLRY